MESRADDALHCINCIIYSLVNEKRDFAVELINKIILIDVTKIYLSIKFFFSIQSEYCCHNFYLKSTISRYQFPFLLFNAKQSSPWLMIVQGEKRKKNPFNSIISFKRLNLNHAVR